MVILLQFLDRLKNYTQKNASKDCLQRGEKEKKMSFKNSQKSLLCSFITKKYKILRFKSHPVPITTYHRDTRYFIRVAFTFISDENFQQKRERFIETSTKHFSPNWKWNESENLKNLRWGKWTVPVPSQACSYKHIYSNFDVGKPGKS